MQCNAIEIDLHFGFPTSRHYLLFPSRCIFYGCDSNVFCNNSVFYHLSDCFYVTRWYLLRLRYHRHTHFLYMAKCRGLLTASAPLAMRTKVNLLDFPSRCIHRIHRRQHVSEDDAGISKHRLSPYNAYYHNWLTLNFTASDSSSKVTKASVIGNQHFCGLKTTSDIVIYVLLKKKIPESWNFGRMSIRNYAVLWLRTSGTMLFIRVYNTVCTLY